MAGSPEPPSSNVTAVASEADLVPSHGISLDLPKDVSHGRPAAVKHMSLPAYQSPIRHHQRTPSRTTHVKETLNARSHYGSSDDDGAAIHRINQYIVKQEIGRGSFGAVHLAVDQYGKEYAVKEFSKSRLRKRAQSNLLRRPNQKRQPGHSAAGRGFNSPLHRMSASDKMDQKDVNPLGLIKEEIAIMKKLHHNNLASLIEVLDDPEEDSLYMVLEMCKKGVVMRVGLGDTADPYEEETCRCWFRDMILGIEYLHAQGIIHRDIKPDNCLVTEDDILKIVDFGVSEIFEKESDMATAKSAGSPAFMPPELCVAKHGPVSGRAADIWSMGVTLYCLRYGRIPFEKYGMIELYEAIRNDEISLHGEQNPEFADLVHRILEKDPSRRITMDELRNHPWVTKNGEDPLLSAEENCADIVEMPTEAEMDNAITGNLNQLLVVMKAVKRFKRLLFRKRPELMEGIFGRSSRIVAPPGRIQMPINASQRHARSSDAEYRKPMERALAIEGIHHGIVVSDQMDCHPEEVREPEAAEPSGVLQVSLGTETVDEVTTAAQEAKDVLSKQSIPGTATEEHTRGHAHDPLLDTLYLDIGTGQAQEGAENTLGTHVVCESPGAVETDVYEAAYQEEMQRILERRGRSPTMYLTRRVEGNKAIREHESIIREGGDHSGWANLVHRVREGDHSGGEEAS